jgi:hypothetical protein
MRLRDVARLLAITVSLLPLIASAEGWLCVADASAGFSVNETNTRWTPTTFKAEAKYLVRQPTKDEAPEFGTSAWVVVPVGEVSAIAKCPTAPNDYGFLKCEGLTSFEINVKRLRFIRTDNGTYFVPEEFMKETRLPPSDAFIEIGQCSSL